MKKTFVAVLLALTLIASVSLGVLAIPATANPAGYHPVAAPKPVVQAPQVANQHQTPANSNGSKMNPPLAVNGQHPSKLAIFKQYFHDKIIPRVKSGWQHLKDSKIWHRAAAYIAQK